MDTQMLFFYDQLQLNVKVYIRMMQSYYNG